MWVCVCWLSLCSPPWFYSPFFLLTLLLWYSAFWAPMYAGCGPCWKNSWQALLTLQAVCQLCWLSPCLYRHLFIWESPTCPFFSCLSFWSSVEGSRCFCWLMSWGLSCLLVVIVPGWPSGLHPFSDDLNRGGKGDPLHMYNQLSQQLIKDTIFSPS